MKKLVFAAFAVIVMSVSAYGQNVNISNGANSFFWDTNSGAANLFTAGISQDHLFTEKWYLRYNDGGGIGSNIVTSDLVNDAVFLGVTGSGNTQTASFQTDSVAGGSLYNVDITLSMSAYGKLTTDIDITYSNGANAPGSGGNVSAFHYFDAQLGSFSEELVRGTTSQIGLFDPNDAQGNLRSYRTATNSIGFEIQDWAAGANIEDRLNATYNLTNSPGILNGADATGAFQWDFTFGATGDVQSLQEVFAVPEPTFGMIGILALTGLGALRRRR